MTGEASRGDARAVLVVVVSAAGLRKLVDWVAAGATFDERERRGEVAKRAVDELLARTDHDAVNTQIRSALLRFDHAATTWTWSPPNPSRN
jgi:hypothetical protein